MRRRRQGTTLGAAGVAFFCEGTAQQQPQGSVLGRMCLPRSTLVQAAQGSCQLSGERPGGARHRCCRLPIPLALPKAQQPLGP